MMEYKRLTIEQAIKHAREVAEERKDLCEDCRDEHLQLALWLEELKSYKDKIEQGKMIEVPCKVGDTVYLVHRDKLIIECWEVKELNIEHSGIWLIIRNNELLLTSIHSKSKGVCFTREEAEKRLKELQNGNKKEIAEKFAEMVNDLFPSDKRYTTICKATIDEICKKIIGDEK